MMDPEPTTTSPPEAEAEAQASATITLPYGELAPGWKLRQPLEVAVQQDAAGDHLVSETLFNVYGVGDTLNAALQDYISSLIEYYELLEAGVERNPLDRPQLQHLQAYLRPARDRSHAA